MGDSLCLWSCPRCSLLKFSLLKFSVDEYALPRFRFPDSVFVLKQSIPILQQSISHHLHTVCSEPWRIKHLRELQTLVAKYLDQDVDTPIVRIIIGNTEEVIRMSDTLWAKGFHVPAIRPPVVPNGTSRLRVSLSTEHTAEEVLELLKCLDGMGLRSYIRGCEKPTDATL